MAQQPLVGQGLPIIKASRSHSDTPHLVGLLWTSDKPDTETYPSRHTHTHSQETNIYAPAVFEAEIPASERPQTHVLDHAATGICNCERRSCAKYIS